MGREVYIKGTDITNESDLWKTQLYKGFEKHGTDDQLAHPANANLATGGGRGISAASLQWLSACRPAILAEVR